MDVVDATRKFLGSYVSGAINVFSKSVRIVTNCLCCHKNLFDWKFYFACLNFQQTGNGNNPAVKIEKELVLQAKTKADLAVNEMQKMVRVAHPILKLAGISGAAAVCLGAYGAHGKWSSFSEENGYLKLCYSFQQHSWKEKVLQMNSNRYLKQQTSIIFSIQLHWWVFRFVVDLCW